MESTASRPERIPTGTVTFLFTDIEGSTQRWERDRAAMESAVRQHDAIMRDAIESNGGAVFKTIGDAFCAVFARPDEAVSAALAAQQRLAGEDFSAVGGIRVRMALHTGTADERDHDYFGPTVNRVARLLSAGHGGQVLLSHVTADLVRAHLPQGASLRDLGRHRLKDLAEPIGIEQLTAANLPGDFPPLRSLDAHPNNLPAQLTALIGREYELSEAKQLFESARLLTMVGAGGVGKTRLAVQLAADLADGFPDGVWFVDLAPLTDGRFIAPTILLVSGGREEPGRDTNDALRDYLREKKALLVFDNCEHVVRDAANVIERLMRECPRLHVLATSRHVLEIPGEVVFRVSTFDEERAAALFVSRATAVVPSFRPTADATQTIKRICARLDGIALAIELAAARVKMMNVEELWKRLDERFWIIAGGQRMSLGRQQTLRGLIEWSYNLLEESEKVLLRRLAIFAGRFSLDSAAAICGFDLIDEFEVMDLLGWLIDKSLVQYDPTESLYWLFESTKSFALERLTDAGEYEELQRRRAERLRDRAEEGLQQVWRGYGDGARREITREYADYRAAMQWALAERHDVVLGAGIATALHRYWQYTGQWQEGRYWLEMVLPHGADLLGLEIVARAHLGLAVQAYVQGEFAEMAEESRQAEAAYECLGDVAGMARARVGSYIAAFIAGDLEKAEALAASCLTTFREIGDARNEAVMLSNLAELTDAKGDHAQAERLYGDAVRIHRSRGDSTALATALNDWGQSAAHRGAYDRATELFREALDLYRQIGDDVRVTEVLVRSGHAAFWAGDVQAARRLLQEACDRLRTAPHAIYLAWLCDACAELAVAMKRNKDATLIVGFGEMWRAAKGIRRSAPLQQRYEQITESLRATLGEEAYDAALREGAALTPQAILQMMAEVLSSEV